MFSVFSKCRSHGNIAPKPAEFQSTRPIDDLNKSAELKIMELAVNAELIINFTVDCLLIVASFPDDKCSEEALA